MTCAKKSRSFAFAAAAVSASAIAAIYAYSALRPDDFSERKVEAAAALTAAVARYRFFH